MAIFEAWPRAAEWKLVEVSISISALSASRRESPNQACPVERVTLRHCQTAGDAARGFFGAAHNLVRLRELRVEVRVHCS